MRGGAGFIMIRGAAKAPQDVPPPLPVSGTYTPPPSEAITMRPHEPHVAALTLTAREQAQLLTALDRHLTLTPPSEIAARLRTVRDDLSTLSSQEAGILLSAGGAGLRLLHDVLVASDVDPSLVARVREEAYGGQGPLKDEALVTIIFDARPGA
jgi:hypothetical protein